MKPKAKRTRKPKVAPSPVEEPVVEAAADVPVAVEPEVPAEAPTETAAEPASAPAEEPQADDAEAKPARANRGTNVSSSEPVVKSAGTPEEAEKPKKAGWWQRRGFF